MNAHVFVYDEGNFPYPAEQNTPEEEIMRDGFVKVATEVSGEQDLYRQDNPQVLAGIELELPLVDDSLALMQQSIRDQIIAQTPNTSIELSAHQLEVTPSSPANLSRDINELEQGMEASLSAVRLASQPMGASWLRMGSYPLCHINDMPYTTGYEKYYRSPHWHMENQRPGLDKYLKGDLGNLDVSSGYVVGLMNALQVTVDAIDFDDAFDKINRSFLISPMATALGAHSSHLGFMDTGYKDVRFVTWRISHDTRTSAEVSRQKMTRVGMPSSYYSGLNHYFNEIMSYPFVMNDEGALQHPFEVGNGIFWRDARLKFFRDKKKVGIEFRPMSIQPTLTEDIAMVLFYIGRLLWSQKNQEPLLPIDKVHENKESAMQAGMSSFLWMQMENWIDRVPARQVLSVEIDRATEGLALLEPDAAKRLYYMDILRTRLSSGSPAEQFVKVVGNVAGRHKTEYVYADARERLVEAIQIRKLIER